MGWYLFIFRQGPCLARLQQCRSKMPFDGKPVSMTSRLGVLCVLLAIVVAACSPSGSSSGNEAANSLGGSGAADGETNPTIAINNEPAIALPDFGSPGELEQALISYGECVEESFPIAMRFRVDPFVGLYTEIDSQREDEGDLVDQVAATCLRRLDLDRRLSVYMQEHPLSPADESELVAEFVSCANSVSPAAADFVSATSLDSLDSVTRLIIELVPSGGDVPMDDLLALSECEVAITGPRRVFDDGHPWFAAAEN